MKKILLFLAFIILSTICAKASDMRFVQVDSMLLSASEEKSIEKMQKVINDINNQKNIEFVVFTGDNIANPKQENLECFVKISIYKLFTHQHLDEIRQNLARVGQQSGSTGIPVVNFVPLRGDFARGIFASVYTRAAEGMTLEDYRKLYEDYYADSPFVFHSAEGISMKEVVNTNKGLVHVELHDGYVHIASCIDNLVKGAAGQAVQNMNLMFGLPEDRGLRLKPSAF